jgi:hypothetical protein
MGGGGKDGDSEGRHRWMTWQSCGSITTISICSKLGNPGMDHPTGIYTPDFAVKIPLGLCPS